MPANFTYKGIRRSWYKVLSLLATGLYLFLGTLPAGASLNFIQFNAYLEVDKVRLEWETSAEVDITGFNIQRSLQRDTGYENVNEDLIPSEADEQGGHRYTYVDFEIESNTTYWYRIQAVEISGSTHLSEVKLAAASTPTATTTATGTAANTDSAYPGPGTVDPNALNTSTPVSYPGPGGNPSPVPTSSTATAPAPTATSPGPGPTLTRTQGSPTLPGTVEPSPTLETSGITTTGSLTITATLIPLPNLTLIFPEPTEVALLVTATPEAAPPPPWSSPRRLVPVALVVMIWVILGAWFYYSQRNIG